MDERGGHSAETMMAFSLPNLHFSRALDVNRDAFVLDDSSSKRLISQNIDNVRFSTATKTAQSKAARTSKLINRSQSLRDRQLRSAYQGAISQRLCNPPHLIQKNSSTLFISQQQVQTSRDIQGFQGPVAMLGVRGSTSASTSRPRGAYAGNRGATDTTLSVLLHSRESLNSKDNNNSISNELNNSTAQVNFNTMRYPDRKALYLLGQSSNETTTQRWLSRLIARREQRNSQFLQRLKEKQDQNTGNNQNPAGVPPPFNTSNSNTRNSFRNNVAPHRFYQQTTTSITPVNLNSRGGRQSSAGLVTINRGGTPKSSRRPGHLESGELFMSNSTGMLHNLNGVSTIQGNNHRARPRSNENEITVDLTKENTTNIAYRLLGAYIDGNPTPLTKTFMNIGEAPSAFVEEYLQDRCMEKLDYRAICTMWLNKLIYEWEIIED